MEDDNERSSRKRSRECKDDKVKDSSKKRSKRPKRLEFEGWGSKNLIEFLQSLGVDTTNRISEYDVTEIVTNYIRELKRETPSDKKRKTKTVLCDEKLRSLFKCKTINIIKVADLVDKHYVENQDDKEFDFLYGSEDDEEKRSSLSDKVGQRTKVVAKAAVQKPKGTFAAIVRDNIKLLYLRKSLVQELAKTPETFESKVVGAFVRIKNPYQFVQVTPYQLVRVTGVKEGNPIDGYFLQVTNYSYYLEDAPVNTLSDKDFSQEECEELHQRIKNGSVKRLTVVDMEEKVRSLHEDLTKHWLATELKLLKSRIAQANENGWRRELSQYLDKRELLNNPEEQSRLLREVPEVVAEVLEPECADDDRGVENDFIEPNPEAFLESHRSDKEEKMSELELERVDDDGKTEKGFVEPNAEASLEAHQSDKVNPKLRDGGEQPEWIAYANDKDLLEDAFEQPANVITQNMDSKPPENVITQNKGSEPPAKGIAQNNDSEQPAIVITQNMNSEPPVKDITQNKDFELPENVITQIMDSEPPANTKQDKESEPPSNVITQSKKSEPPANIISQNMDFIPKIEMIDLTDEPQVQPNPIEIIELSDDEDEDDNLAIQEYDPKKVMWYYEYPKGKTHGPFPLTALKQWNDEEYFVGIPDFKVWTKGESAVSLTKLLPLIKT